MPKIVMLLLVAATACPAQTFEVASVRPAAPVKQAGGGGRRTFYFKSTDPQQFREASVSLKSLLLEAYSIKNYQLDGPAWLDDQRYDVTAKLPDGSVKEQIPAMLQNLLIERFKLKEHDETRQDHVLALIVGKTGPHLHESPRKGTDAPPRNSWFDITGHMGFSGFTLAFFADALSSMLGRPVLDMTQIPGYFDISLDVSVQELAGLKAAGVPLAENDSSTSIFSAIQELGLKLESRTEPIRHIVVESAQKIPIGN